MIKRILSLFERKSPAIEIETSSTIYVPEVRIRTVEKYKGIVEVLECGFVKAIESYDSNEYIFMERKAHKRFSDLSEIIKSRSKVILYDAALTHEILNDNNHLLGIPDDELLGILDYRHELTGIVYFSTELIEIDDYCNIYGKPIEVMSNFNTYRKKNLISLSGYDIYVKYEDFYKSWNTDNDFLEMFILREIKNACHNIITRTAQEIIGNMKHGRNLGFLINNIKNLTNIANEEDFDFMLSQTSPNIYYDNSNPDQIKRAIITYVENTNCLSQIIIDCETYYIVYDANHVASWLNNEYLVLGYIHKGQDNKLNLYNEEQVATDDGFDSLHMMFFGQTLYYFDNFEESEPTIIDCLQNLNDSHSYLTNYYHHQKGSLVKSFKIDE